MPRKRRPRPETSDVRCRCGTTFSDDEPRCPRCGRRIQTVLLPDTISVAVAAEPQPEPPAEQPRKEPAPALKQAHLFGAQKIIPFETLVTTRRQFGRRREPPREEPAPRAHARQTQPDLELRAPAAPVRSVALFEHASIAPPVLRARAALADLGMCAIGIALFAGAFLALGGRFVLNAATAPFYGGAAAAMVLFYHLFFAMIGRDTPGAAWYRLRVVTFDGFAPEWRLRVARLVVALLCTLAIGLGPLWILIDDEALSWHDQITKTFPTQHKRD